MNFYELVLVIKQDVLASDVNSVVAGLLDSIEPFGGRVVKREAWGLRKFAYYIGSDKRGHYVFLALHIGVDGIVNLKTKVKNCSDVLRHLLLKVDMISDSPSPILDQEKVEINKTAAF